MKGVRIRVVKGSSVAGNKRPINVVYSVVRIATKVSIQLSLIAPGLISNKVKKIRNQSIMSV